MDSIFKTIILNLHGGIADVVHDRTGGDVSTSGLNVVCVSSADR